eukprot:UN02585
MFCLQNLTNISFLISMCALLEFIFYFSTHFWRWFCFQL